MDEYFENVGLADVMSDNILIKETEKQIKDNFVLCSKKDLRTIERCMAHGVAWAYQQGIPVDCNWIKQFEKAWRMVYDIVIKFEGADSE